MADWIKELLLVTAAEFHGRPIVAALATVDPTGRPHNRTVILRHINAGDGTAVIATDARSHKMAELAHRAEGELVIWSPHEREQFRIFGRVEILRTGDARADQWVALSDVNRAMYFWPPPGETCRPGDLFRSAAPSTEPPPECFVLLRLHPEEVECLELNEHPHRRRRWLRSRDWAEERLNP